MDIWHLNSAYRTSLSLWRVSEAKFKVVQQGQPLTLLTNSDYILIDKKYKTIFDKLKEQVTTRPVMVIDEVRKLIFDNFIELNILNEIQFQEPDKLDSKGLKIWRFSEGYVFVSTDLKYEFQNMNDQEFEFTVGLSNFAESGGTNDI